MEEDEGGERGMNVEMKREDEKDVEEDEEESRRKRNAYDETAGQNTEIGGRKDPSFCVASMRRGDSCGLFSPRVCR